MSTFKEITYQFSVHFRLDVSGEGKEGIFYVDASLSTRFHELYPMFYCQLQGTSKIISISSFLSRIKLVYIESNIINYIYSKVVYCSILVKSSLTKLYLIIMFYFKVSKMPHFTCRGIVILNHNRRKYTLYPIQYQITKK